RTVGDRRTNETQLLFEPVEFTGKLPPDPHKLEVPDGRGTWAIVCRPKDGFFYLLHNGTVRKFDYSKPRNVTDTPADDLPAEFRDEVKRQLEIAGVSDAQQAEIFEKPAPPASTPELKTSQVNEELKPGAKINLATEQKLKWGERVNGLRAALVMQPVPDEPDADDKNDIFLVVQNVTKAEVWLHASDAAANPRQLIWRDKGVLETINEVAKPIHADFRLQPDEVAFFRMTHPPGKRNPGGRSTGSLIEESIRKDPTFSLEGSMEISTAPEGAWSANW
ncbi:MAG: hypothetical protein ABL921_08060, partial [Pirellula sp.]